MEERAITEVAQACRKLFQGRHAFEAVLLCVSPAARLTPAEGCDVLQEPRRLVSVLVGQIKTVDQQS